MLDRKGIKNIVIAGAGPIGLYIAIRLNQIIKKAHLKTKVTVVDRRAGDYNRPGVIANRVLELLEEHLNASFDDVSKPTPNSMFIQDLELSLYKKARSMGVTIINSQFKSFTPEEIVVVDDNKRKTSLSCDLAVDCTGQARVLINEINKHSDEEPFEITRVNDNPIKDHFVAYITMDHHNADLSTSENQDIVQYVLAFEELREKFGWAEFDMPTIDTGRWADPDDKDKIYKYYYFEIPPSLAKATKEKHEAWLKALLKLRTGNDIQFESGKGLKFIPFTVDPHVVSPACYLANDKKTPMVLASGGCSSRSRLSKGFRR